MDLRKPLCIKFHYCFKNIYRFPQCFKFIYRFLFTFTTYLWILYYDYPPSPCIWTWKSLVVLVDYVSPLWGINNHVNPQGIWSKNTSPWLNSVIYRFTTLWIFIFSPFSPYDLGVKILSGLGGLCSPLRGINNHINPQGIRSINTSPCLNTVIYIIYYVVVNIVHFFILIWVWKFRPVLEVVDKSFNSTKPYVNPWGIGHVNFPMFF